MDDLRQDLRFALRTLAKSPGFTLVVVLTLALGIGANTAIFTLMDQVLLRALPVREPERLVVLDGPGAFSGSSHNHSDTLIPLSHPMFERLRDQNTVFAGVLAHYTAPVHLTVGPPDRQRERRPRLGHVLRGAGREAGRGPALHGRGRPHPGRPPRGGPGPRLLDPPLRGRSEDRGPGGAA